MSEEFNGPTPKMSDTEIAFSEIIGDLVEQWGFKRHLGRVWSLLYLRTNPLNPKQIQEELNLSAGSVSATLVELQTWGVVKRIRVAGDRNFYFEAETHIWKSVSNVLRARELRILEEAYSGIKNLTKTMAQNDDQDMANFHITRAEHVLDAISTSNSIMEHFVNMNPENVEKLAKLVKKLTSL
ncbi:MAG: hypothetical protein HOE90_08805 [Bacteriovoracaceae bacterium]|nr:hypothetical protein [Bacteriovoracaceae bacterium]